MGAPRLDRDTSGRHAGIPLVTRALVQAGARVPSNALESLAGDSDAAMRAALAAVPSG